MHLWIVGDGERVTLVLLLSPDTVSDAVVHNLMIPQPATQQPSQALLLVLLAKGRFAALAEAPGMASCCEGLLAPSRGPVKTASLGLTTWQGMLPPAAASQLVLSSRWVRRPQSLQRAAPAASDDAILQPFHVYRISPGALSPGIWACIPL